MAFELKELDRDSYELTIGVFLWAMLGGVCYAIMILLALLYVLWFFVVELFYTHPRIWFRERKEARKWRK